MKVAESEVIFESEGFRSIADIRNEGGPILCTFSSYVGEGGNPHASGKDLADTLAVNAIHLINRANDWFQQAHVQQDYAEWAKRVIAHPAFAGAKYRIGYGADMGGYAALRFRDKLPFDRVIALSPQYSLDPAKVPFEGRWRQEYRRYGDTSNDGVRSVARGEAITLLHDPMIEVDRRHIGLIDPEGFAMNLAFPLGGNPPALFLWQTGVFSEMIARLIGGDRDVSDLARLAGARRRKSWLFWLRLADYWINVRPHRERAAWALERGLAIVPEQNDLIALRNRLRATITSSA